MKLRVDIDGERHLIALGKNGTLEDYALDDAPGGSASVEEVRPGVFSILIGSRSFTVNVAARGEDDFEVVSIGQLPHIVSVTDERDRIAPADAASLKGPVSIRAQMPGKIIVLLVDEGAKVEAGQGLIVAEAMKMQNEIKAPRSGVVVKIDVVAGVTVAAGETLMVLE